MGEIDIHDGSMARTIRLRDLNGDIEIEMRGSEAPCVKVPEEFDVERL
ncbi:MAG: DUF4097 and DUF4098 domain-containing protein YvlB [Natronomonas sp.]|jgi:DUF4097 and DUF4098 domain-containing protein YvlB